MGFQGYKIMHFGKDSSGAYLSSGTEITNVISISLTKGIGENADSFNIVLNNQDNYGFKRFQIDDKVKIYSKINSTETLLMDGLVNEKTVNKTVDTNTLTVTGLNLLEKMFNAMVSTTGESVQKTASYLIKNIIDQVNENNNLGNTNREILYNDDTITSTTQKQTYVRGYEKAFKLIEELSKDDFTGDGQYYYYLDENNYFHWEPYDDTIINTFNTNNDFISTRTKKGMYEIVNYIIMNCGKNPYGTTILQFDYDKDSIRKNGWKVKLVTRESIGNELYNRDRNSKPQYWDDDSKFPNEYPYVTSWGVNTTSDHEYNSEFVDEVLAQGKKAIRAILDKSVGATNKVKAEMYHDTSFGYGLGELSNLVIPANYWGNPEKLRIKTVNYGFSKDGWVTDLSFEEDSEIFSGGD